MRDIYRQVEQNIDNLATNNVDFSIPATPQDIDNFKRGIMPSRFFMPPRAWLPESLVGQRILLLAGGGGQQAPLLAACGATVTVMDLSANMLAKDAEIATREGLAITIEKGNICDLSRFADSSFDCIINPPSLFYLPDVLPVFRECYRVLQQSGCFIVNAPNPINYICDYDAEQQVYIARNTLPYVSQEHDPHSNWIEYGHSLEAYIGGQIQCGFVINGFYETPGSDICDGVSFVTRAVKETAACRGRHALQ